MAATFCSETGHGYWPGTGPPRSGTGPPPTGAAWSPNGTRFQIADSRAIWVDDYDTERARATCGRRWVVVADGEGQPSGLATDSEGSVWVAMHGAGRIHRNTHAVNS